MYLQAVRFFPYFTEESLFMGDSIVVSDNTASNAGSAARNAAGNAFLAEVNGKPRPTQPEASKPPEGLVVVCDGKTCVPFSTDKSGDSNSALFVKDNFPTFDRNSNGYVEKDEALYWRNKFENGSPAWKMSNDIATNNQAVSNRSDDQLFYENGISVKDLDSVLNLAARDPKALSSEERALLRSLDWKSREKKSK